MQDETPNDAPDEEATPQEDAPAEEPAAPETDAPAPEEQAAPPVEAPAEETNEEAPAEEASEEAPAEAEAPAEEPAPADAPYAAADMEAAAENSAPEPPAPEPKQKAKDAAPGADLEPLRIEDERQLSTEERARLEAEQEERARLEAAESDDGGAEEPALREGATIDLAPDALVQATGKRKTSIARVVVRRGGGEIAVNGRTLADYFPRSLHQTIARQALTTSGYAEQVDVRVRVRGGGISGQADAVRHGIARALIDIDPELRGELKKRGMLTRDAREKERRKAGLKKARKRPQFSKR
jgi:small subunit ribosomal protein S9